MRKNLKDIRDAKHGKGYLLDWTDDATIAEACCQLFPNVMHDGLRFYEFQEQTAIWKPFEPNEIKKTVKDKMRLMYSLKKRKNATEQVRLNVSKRRTDDVLHFFAIDTMDTKKLSNAPKGIALKKTFVTMTGTEPLNREHAQTFALADEYTTAEPDLFLRTLRQLWESESYDSQDVEARIQLLLEWIGVALMGLASRYHKAILFHGPSGCGKSTIIKVIQALFPVEAVVNISPQGFADNGTFAGLRHARLNLVAELEPTLPIKNTARIKIALEGGSETVRIPHATCPIKVTPLAAHLFASNRFLKVPGVGEDFWDRWITFSFYKQYRGKGGENKSLSAQIIETELAAIASAAIRAARVLYKRDRFIIPKSCEDELKKWKGEADSVTAWLESAVASCDLKDGLTRVQAHASYTNFVSKTFGGATLAKGDFFAQVRAAGHMDGKRGVYKFPLDYRSEP